MAVEESASDLARVSLWCLYSLEGQQLELPDVVNTPLLIRNARVKMEEGHMRLVVDRWGKIS